MKREETYFEKGKGLANFSLLYPPGGSSREANSFLELSPAATHDLGLNELVTAFTLDRRHQKEIRDLFSRLPRDPEVITYRQAVLDDLLANPKLVEEFDSLLPVIDSLYQSSYHLERERNQSG